ncbi:MAG: hypothetical protein HQK49_10895 [Oligoflexia bacterium]|nr:hypothetical protein [Oligoflexia bacterium]
MKKNLRPVRKGLPFYVTKSGYPYIRFTLNALLGAGQWKQYLRELAHMGDLIERNDERRKLILKNIEADYSEATKIINNRLIQISEKLNQL